MNILILYVDTDKEVVYVILRTCVGTVLQTVRHIVLSTDSRLKSGAGFMS